MYETCPLSCSESMLFSGPYGHPSALVAHHSAMQGFTLSTHALTLSNDQSILTGILLELDLSRPFAPES